MKEYKEGEFEALTILKKTGVRIDERYHDDNSRNSMPDIRYKDGRFIEVTHTLHNNDIPSQIRNHYQLQWGEDLSGNMQRLLDTAKKSEHAMCRVLNRDYEKYNTGKFTPTGLTQYKRDVKFIKKHFGYDLTEKDSSKQFSEFKCDLPIVTFSAENIIREIIIDKGKKYPNGDVDLFIFATNLELAIMIELIGQIYWNRYACGFLEKILSSPFPKIYVSEWDYESQKYNTENPRLVVFYKDSNRLKWIMPKISL